MKEVFDKIIGFIHSEIARTTSYAEHDTQINIKFFVEQLRDEYNNGWIPCSERLPEVNTTYLVSLEGYCKPLMAWFGSDKEWYWYNSTAKMDYVIAWQLLPEPFKPKGE